MTAWLVLAPVAIGVFIVAWVLLPPRLHGRNCKCMRCFEREMDKLRQEENRP